MKPEEIEATAPDGYPVHGWLYRPSGPGPHPLLLFVHGGPDIQMGESLVPDAQIYVDAGYAVIISNPRGSAGYGEKHARVICGNVGSVDADDLVALHRAVCERPDIDETRTGVLGGSYGGFMTAWLAAHHGDLFKAALSERGVYSYTSMMGTSDLGSVTASMIGHDPEKWVLQSPLTHAEKIDIPLLIMPLGRRPPGAVRTVPTAVRGPQDASQGCGIRGFPRRIAHLGEKRPAGRTDRTVARDTRMVRETRS